MTNPKQALEELSRGRTANLRAPFDGSINHSYFLLRRWIAFLSIALPLVLWIGTFPYPQPSISQYYHDPGGWMRDAMVGTLSAVGFFLYFYKGYSKVEDWLLNVAGIAAAGVAFAPMPWRGGAENPRLFPEEPFPLHFTCAALLFLVMAYICIFRAKDTLQLVKDANKRARYQLKYSVLGTLMIAVPVSIFLIYRLSPVTGQSRVVFAIEAAGIFIFASYWLVKSREIAFIQQQR